MKEQCRTEWGSNPQPHDHQSNVHLTEPPRSAYLILSNIDFLIRANTLQEYQFVLTPSPLSFWSGLFRSWIWTCPLMQIGVSIRTQKQNGQQCKFWWDSLLSAISSGSTLFELIIVLAESVKGFGYTWQIFQYFSLNWRLLLILVCLTQHQASSKWVYSNRNKFFPKGRNSFHWESKVLFIRNPKILWVASPESVSFLWAPKETWQF